VLPEKHEARSVHLGRLVAAEAFQLSNDASWCAESSARRCKRGRSPRAKRKVRVASFPAARRRGAGPPDRRKFVARGTQSPPTAICFVRRSAA
jgi:hypothetical protein